MHLLRDGLREMRTMKIPSIGGVGGSYNADIRKLWKKNHTQARVAACVSSGFQDRESSPGRGRTTLEGTGAVLELGIGDPTE